MCFNTIGAGLTWLFPFYAILCFDIPSGCEFQLVLQLVFYVVSQARQERNKMVNSSSIRRCGWGKIVFESYTSYATFLQIPYEI